MQLASNFKPLYRRVQELLTKRISEGQWKPAQILPNEHALASELGVSQGTVRKALNGMVTEQLLERRQGKGTYVLEQTPERSHYRFYRMSRPGGVRMKPEAGKEAISQRNATAIEAGHLALERGAKVYEIIRSRNLDGKLASVETIVIPASRFRDLESYAPLPDALYAFFQSTYGINVVSVKDELKADVAKTEDVKRLKIAKGTPLLHVERVAISMDGEPVEWRVTRFITGDYVYAVELR